MRGREGKAGEEGAVVVDERVIEPSILVKKESKVCCGERPILSIRVEGELYVVWVTLGYCV